MIIILVANQHHHKKKFIHLEVALAPNDLLLNLDFLHVLEKTEFHSRSTNNSKQMKMSSEINSTNDKVAELLCASTGLCFKGNTFFSPTIILEGIG